MEQLSLAFDEPGLSAWPMPLGVPCTFRELTREGVTRPLLRSLLRHGHVRRLLKGVYIDGRTPETVDLRAAALRMVCPPDAVVVDRHAGWLHGASMVLAPGEHLALRPLSIDRPSGHGRLRNPISSSGERRLRDEDITEVNGIPVTTVLRTAWDLGRVRWPDEAIAGMDAMARLDGFAPDRFQAGVEQFRGQRWVRVLRAVAPLVDGRSESPPESILRLRCHRMGLHLEPQVEVWEAGEFLGRLDLGDKERRVGLEYDSDEWHSTPDQLAHDRCRRGRIRDAGWKVDALRRENVFGHSADLDLLLGRLKRHLQSTSASAYDPWR